MRGRQSAATWWEAHRPEASVFAAIFVIAVIVRLWNLGTIPQIVTGDETDNLQVAYRIIKGTGPGFFGFDWKPAPSFSMYPLAWTVQLFGDSVFAFRLYPVILSLLTIVMFYVVARETLGARSSLLGMALLATNLWFLHFSRTAWENSNAALFALGACWCTQRALATGRLDWWGRAGIFVAAGLYGYFTGRFIFLSVGAIAFIAILCGQAPWRKTLTGLALAAAVTAVLFGPMAWKIYDDWDHFNSRTKNVSVFNSKNEPYEGRTNGWDIAYLNLQRNFRGLILQDKTEFGRGLWARYNPEARPPLDLISGPLFLAGLLLGLWKWRQTYYWFTFLIPLAIAEIFSKGTPDLARAVLFAPFYFLFIGLLFEELDRFRPRQRRLLMSGVVVLLVAWIGAANVYGYFRWQNRNVTQVVRLPGVDVCEFDAWHEIAMQAARQGALVSPESVEELHRTLLCSDAATPR
jgi:4-amino-4-deoxy-L-arabinose transferase-like glycosyltransferase